MSPLSVVVGDRGPGSDGNGCLGASRGASISTGVIAVHCSGRMKSKGRLHCREETMGTDGSEAVKMGLNELYGRPAVVCPEAELNATRKEDA